jgi:phenylglyoxylate dehydrogenase epsilon subunit
MAGLSNGVKESLDMAKRHLIIGCGTAALSAAKKIRSIAQEDEIKLVTMEDCLPYSPASLPYLLSGRLKEDNLWVVNDSLLREWRFDLAKGKEVVGLKVEQKEVIYKDGEQERYDTLLIASGSEPSKPPIRGLETAGFVGFHTLKDSRELSKKLDGRKEVTIYGGGMVALGIATALLERGLKVKIVVRSRIARGYFDEQVGAFIELILRQHGAEVYGGSKIDEIRKIKGRTKIILSDGRSFDTDIMIVSAGIEPRVSFLAGTGLLINRGILVDKQMRTNLPDVYAAGDVVEAYDFFFGQAGINAITPSAVQQGKVAGANMAGEKVEDRGWVPMNLFKFFGHTAFSIGLFPRPSYQVLKWKDDSSGIYKVFVFQENQLVGARFIDVNIDPGIIRYLIEEKVDIGQFKEELIEHPQETSRRLMLRSEQN